MGTAAFRIIYFGYYFIVTLFLWHLWMDNAIRLGGEAAHKEGFGNNL